MLDFIPGQKPEDRLDIVNRVFLIKLNELIEDIYKKKRFGKAIAIVYTSEFQKRGLPHAHILLFLDPDDRDPSPQNIDQIISAEVPDKDVDPEGNNYDEIQMYLDARYLSAGKTFLWKAITTSLRSEGKIVLAVASSAIAALLIPGGRTAHSRFHIRLNINNESTCDIKQGSYLADLLKKTSLIIWDEAPMANKHWFEALDKSLRDILRFTNASSADKPFGGMTVVMGRDFRQILPVIPKGRRSHIVDASLKHSYLWNHFEEFQLTQNMRVSALTDTPKEQKKTADFADWVNIGDGLVGNKEEEAWVHIPEELLLQKGENQLETIINNTYPNLWKNYMNRTYLEERAILCPRNEMVDEVNSYIMGRIEGEEVTYRSSDTVCKAMSNSEDGDHLYPTEFL
nr:uncharacterized protein LOC120973949 [Aegilops tauschii subsp. strangulata]